MFRLAQWCFAVACCSGVLLAQQTNKLSIPDNLIWEPGIEYAPGAAKSESLKMDIVRPRGAQGALPLIVCIHGGGFRAGTRDGYLPLCIKLAQRGYVAATISYRLSPTSQFPAPVNDAKAAVRWLRANATQFGIDPERIGVTGGSAGGHLALFLGLTGGIPEFEGSGPNLNQSSQVSCVVNYYGPTDFTKSYGKSVDAAEVLPLFLGGDLEHRRLAHIKASPLNWISPNAAPVLTIHGTEDKYVAYEQAVWLTDRLKAAGVETELETIEGAGHGFKGKDAERAERRLFEFFDKHLAKPKEERHILVADLSSAAEILALSWPSGRVLWRVPNNRGHDVQGLPNGHALFTLDAARRVVEIDQDHKIVWSYGPGEGLEVPIAAQRLENGNTLIGDARLGKVIEVDPSRRVVWSYENPDMAYMRMRNCRRTPAGTTLIAIEAAGKIIEVDSKGQIVWSYLAPDAEHRYPYQAHRLQNGNTLVSLANPGEVVEVDKAGKTVRSIGGNKMDIRLGWVSGTQPLPNGGLLLSDYSGRRLVELDASGQVVHSFNTGSRAFASVSLLP